MENENQEDTELDEEFFPDNYDLEEIFDEKIRPLITTIANICDEYDIPMVVAFQHKASPNKIGICASAVLPPNRTCLTMHEMVKLLADLSNS